MHTCIVGLCIHLGRRRPKAYGSFDFGPSSQFTHGCLTLVVMATNVFLIRISDKFFRTVPTVLLWWTDLAGSLYES